MGQKVHPYGFRLGYNKPWHSRWFAKRDFSKLLIEDLNLKRELKSRFASAGVSQIEIDRAANRLRIIIYTSRPGIIIGRKGTEVDKLKQEIQAKIQREVYINIIEVSKPELDAQLVAESIALQLEKRIAFRRAMRKAVDSTLRFGAKGIRVRVPIPPKRPRPTSIRHARTSSPRRLRAAGRNLVTSTGLPDAFAAPGPTRAGAASTCT